jgi:GINS complex subunit 2
MDQTWFPEELSFLAEEEIRIHISPHFSAPKTAFLARECGPFEAGQPIKVQLWFALFLNSSQSCTLIPPKWLSLSSLWQILDRERREKNGLTRIHPYYMEVSHAFITHSPMSIRDLEQVRIAVDQLWHIRCAKIRQAIAESTSETLDFFELPNATRMELHLYREPITRIRSILTELNAVGVPPAEADD